MKAVIYQDIDFLAVRGGAEQTDRRLFYEGLKRGHEMSLVLPESWNATTPATRKPNADIAILSNATRFPPEHLSRSLSDVPYIVFHHDYWHCRFRLFFALQEKCKSCPWMAPWRRLYNEARLNIFMSPLQRDACFSVMPELSERPHTLCPSLLDPAAWPNHDGKRKLGTVFGLNCLLPFKGRANIIDYARKHPETSFTFAGASEGEGELPANAKHIGPIDDEKLAELYSSSESFIHLPRTPQPCERSCIEARLSGCGLILNHLVGATSYPEWRLGEEDFRIWLAERPSKLWEKIEETVNA